MRLPAIARKPQSGADRAARRLLPRTLTLWRPQPDWRLAVVESVVLMVIALALSAWTRPHDPFWSLTEFPWLWLMSTLIALRYGALLGVVSLGVALVGWFVLDAMGAMTVAFPRVGFMGALLLALIAGEFSDVWNSRLNQAQAINAYVDERLQMLTHNHFLLSVSHERLENELISRPYTLRETLTTLRSLLLQSGIRGASRSSAGELAEALAEVADPPAATVAGSATTSSLPAASAASSPLPGAPWLLALLTQLCRLESAALFAIVDESLQPTSVASGGEFGTLDTGDSMLTMALETGQLTHLRTVLDLDLGFGDREGAASKYLVCAPVVSSRGQAFGVLVVARMAFIALNEETLQLLTVVLSYYADGVDQAQIAQPVLTEHPQCRPEFALELAQLARVYTLTAVNSTLVALVTQANNADGLEALSRVQGLRRTLDVHWESTRDEQRVLIVLLPLTDRQGTAGYLDRVGTRMRELYGRDLAALGVMVYTAPVDEREPLAQLNTLLARAAAARTAAPGAASG